MSKERYDQIVEEAYNSYAQHTIIGVNTGLDKIQGHLENCLVEYDGYYEYFTNPSFQYGFRPHTQDEFINKCKTDSELSEKWGLKIEERELSLEERNQWFHINWNANNPLMKSDWKFYELDQQNVPTKLITVTYNDEKIEVYE